MKRLYIDHDSLAKKAFGMTLSEAHRRGVCICCHESPVTHTPEGEKEYTISGMCEPCFDNMFQEEE